MSFRKIFGPIQKITGDRVMLMFSAGAPINPESLLRMKICFNCEFTQGYGCTETAGCGIVPYSK